MQLSEFIRENHPAIIAEWVSFARTLAAPALHESSVLRDHAEEILDAIVLDMSSYQSAEEQAAKSMGRGRDAVVGGAGKAHAIVRLEKGFRLPQLVAEYRALRASVLRLWSAKGDATDIEGVTRFNEAIDEALTQATNRFTETVERHRDEFLGILGHDLKNPLSAVIMGASLLTVAEGVDDRSARIAAGVLSSAKRMNRMVGDLLDLTRARLSGGIPIVAAEADLADVCSQVVSELGVGHPDEPIRLRCRGDLHGYWDTDRLAQVVSNLVGNAIQHGTKHAPVTIDVRDDGDDVLLEVHNEGPPIPESALGNIFEPMMRRGQRKKTSTSLGLGLYISRQIIAAHGGTIGVSSTRSAGTTFFLRLPRRAPRSHDPEEASVSYPERLRRPKPSRLLHPRH